MSVDDLKKMPTDLQTVVRNLGVLGVRTNDAVTREEQRAFLDNSAVVVAMDEATPFAEGDLEELRNAMAQFVAADRGNWLLPRVPYPGRLSTPWPEPAAKTVVLERPSKEILKRVAITDIQPVDDMDLRASLALEAESLLGYSVLRKEMKLTSPLAATLKALDIEPFSDESVFTYAGEMKDFAQQEARKTNPYANAVWCHNPLARYPRPIPEIALQKACEIKRALPAAEFMVMELNVHPDPFLMVRLGTEEFYIEVWDEPKFEGR